MSKEGDEKALQKLQAESKTDIRYSRLETVLERFGFIYIRKTGHTHMWKHDELKDCPQFPGGRIQVGAHYQDTQGRSSPTNARDVISAARWVMDKRKEENEK